MLLGKAVVVLVVDAVCGDVGGSRAVLENGGISLQGCRGWLFCLLLLVIYGECTSLLWSAFICMCWIIWCFIILYMLFI